MIKKGFMDLYQIQKWGCITLASFIALGIEKIRFEKMAEKLGANETTAFVYSAIRTAIVIISVIKTVSYTYEVFPNMEPLNAGVINPIHNTCCGLARIATSLLSGALIVPYAVVIGAISGKIITDIFCFQAKLSLLNVTRMELKAPIEFFKYLTKEYDFQFQLVENR